MTAPKLDFYPVLETPEKLVFWDTTKNPTLAPYEINTLTFMLVSPYRKNGNYEADVMPYIYAQRQNKELYSITSDIAGIEEGKPIPDGVYSATFLVNNMYQTTHTFLIYQATKAKIEKRLNTAGFRVEANGVNLNYQNSDKYDYETMSILYSLLGTMERSMLDGNIKAAEMAFNTANRVLNTIEKQGYEII